MLRAQLIWQEGEGLCARGAQQQAQGRVEVVEVLRAGGVAEDQVVRRVAEPGQDLQSAPGDEPDPAAGDSGLGQRRLGHPLVLGVGVDRGQHPVGTHAAQQPQRRDAGAGAQLDHVAGASRGGDASGYRWHSAHRRGGAAGLVAQATATRGRDVAIVYVFARPR